MSVGQDFDPSLLERKDRTELVAIATTLGGKVPSRAKKAEIVDLILDLAGVGRGEGDAGAAESEGGEAAATSEPAPQGGAESAQGPAPQGRQGSGDRAEDARAEEEAAAAADAVSLAIDTTASIINWTGANPSLNSYAQR